MAQASNPAGVFGSLATNGFFDQDFWRWTRKQPRTNISTGASAFITAPRYEEDAG
jgi:hypothetical protein